jgi:hypothetical protein
MLLRRSTRETYDRMHVGSGAAERLCAALILGGAVFGGVFVTSAVAGLVLAKGLLLSSVALAAVLVPSAILILGPADDDLEAVANNPPPPTPRAAKTVEDRPESRPPRPASAGGAAVGSGGLGLQP